MKGESYFVEDDDTKGVSVQVEYVRPSSIEGYWTLEHANGDCLRYKLEEIRLAVKFKYNSTDPNVSGQDEVPDMPLGMCQHCGKPKEQHKDNGAISLVGLACLQISLGGTVH
jgi:hypothetical protein